MQLVLFKLCQPSHLRSKKCLIMTSLLVGGLTAGVVGSGVAMIGEEVPQIGFILGGAGGAMLGFIWGETAQLAVEARDPDSDEYNNEPWE